MSAFPPFDAVLFDLDGTLVDSLGTVADAMVQAFTLHGLPASREEIIPLIGAPVPDYARARYGLSPEQAEAVTRDYQRIYHECYIDRTPAHEGADTLVRALHAHGILLGIVTNKNAEGAARILELHDWTGLFAHVTSRETAPPKPSPEAALSTLRVLDVAPARTAIVGDSEYDMRCGRDAGLAAVIGIEGERTASTLRDEGATHVVARLADVAPLLGVAAAA